MPLDLDAEVKNLELGRLFAAVAPGTPPTAEGRFEFATTMTGEGLNPLDLALSSVGEVRLSGRDGVFRGLAADAGTGSKAARVIGILTFSRELKAIGRLLDGLGEIHFKRADLKLERTPDRIELSQLSIVSPQAADRRDRRRRARAFAARVAEPAERLGAHLLPPATSPSCSTA